MIADLPLEVKVFLAISLVATGGALLFIFFLLSSRQIKNNLKNKESNLRNRFQSSLNVIMLMESSEDEPTASSQFYLAQLKKDMGESTLAKQVMTDQLIGLRKSLMGVAAEGLTSLFKKLQLDTFSEHKAKSIGWSKKAQGIFELAQMGNKDSYESIKPNLHSKNATVREEAFMALVKLDKDQTLLFLNEYHAPLSQWMEMRIHQHLSTSDKRSLPDFSQWFNHSNVDVALFALSMTRQFRQLNSAQKLVSLLDDPNELKVSIAIDALGDLDAHDAATSLANYLTKFWHSANLSKRIARSLGKIGYAENHWKALSAYLKHPNYAVRFEATQSLFKSGNNSKQALDSSNADGVLSAMISHVEDPLLQM